MVHAPGRPVPPRVPGRPGPGQHPRGHRPARAGGRADPPAGPPLRHRRRHPLLRHRGAGRRHRLRGGRRPGPRAGGRPSRSVRRPTSQRLRPLEPEIDPPYVARGGPAPGRAARDVPAHRLRRRALHRGQLPGRGRAVPHLRPGEGADARRARLWQALLDRLADLAAGLPARPGRRRGRPPSSCSTAGPASCPPPLRGAACCRPPAGSSTELAGPSGRPDHPLRGGDGRAAPPDGHCRDRVVGVDWRVPLDEARRRVGPGMAVQGNLDPALCLAPLGGGRGRDPRRSWPGRAPLPATSSTWATACSPRPTRASSSAVVELVHAEGRAGVAVPATSPTRARCRARRSACWSWPTAPRPRPRRSRPSTPASAGAGRPPPSSWPTWPAATRPSAGSRRWPSRTAAQVDGLAAALEARRPGRYRSATGPSTPRPPSRRAPPTLVGAGVDRVVGLVLTPHQSSLGSGRVPRAGRPRPPAAPPAGFTADPPLVRRRRVRRAAGRAHRRALAGLDGTAARPVAVFFTAHCLPERVVAEGDPYPDQVAASAAVIAGRPGWTDGRRSTWGVAWQSAGRTPDPWIGPDLLDEIGRAGRRRGRRRGGVPGRLRRPTTSRSSTTSTSRPRQVARPAARLRPHRLAQRRPPLPRAPGRRGVRGRGRHPAGAAVDRHDAGATARPEPDAPGHGGRGRGRHRRAGRRLGADAGPAAPVGPHPTWSCSRPATGSAASCAPPVRRPHGRRRPPTASSARAPRPPAVPGARPRRRPRPRSGRRGRRSGPGAACRTLPDGLALGVPTRWWPVARSGICRPTESLRWPPTSSSPPAGPGPPRRPGRRAARRPPARARGGRRAGRPAGRGDPRRRRRRPERRGPLPLAPRRRPSSRAASCAGCAPAQPRRRRRRPPVFGSLRHPGRLSLAGRLAAALRRAGVGSPWATGRAVERRDTEQGVAVRTRVARRTHSTVSGSRAGPRAADDGPLLEADGVVLAVPATEAADLLAPPAPEAAGLLGRSTTPRWPWSRCPPAGRRRRAGRNRLPGAPHLDDRRARPAARHRAAPTSTEVAASGPAGRRAGPGLGRAASGTNASPTSTTTSWWPLATESWPPPRHRRRAPLDAVVTRWTAAFPSTGGPPAPGGPGIGQRWTPSAVGRGRRRLPGVGIPACIASGRGGPAGARPLHGRRGREPAGREHRPTRGGLRQPTPPSAVARRREPRTARPDWRPSTVRITHRRHSSVAPRRGAVAIPGPGRRRRPRPLAPAVGLLDPGLPRRRPLLVASRRVCGPGPGCWAGWLAGLGCYVPGLMWARAFTLLGAMALIVVEPPSSLSAALVVPARAARGPGPLPSRRP